MIGVVYLCRLGNHPDMVDAFVTSYMTHDAGINHQLVIIFKGFIANSPEILSQKQKLDQIQYEEFFIPDDGFDITAYEQVFRSRQFSYLESFCFLNSHAQICADNWLIKLNNALNVNNVGLVGATGSYYSFFSDHIKRLPKKPSLAIKGLDSSVRNVLMSGRWLLAWFRQFWGHVLIYGIYFDRFPNPHLRTNGFMAKKSVLKNVVFGRIKNKLDAYRFESGKKGLTKQILKMGLDVLVVANTGEYFQIDDWVKSETFWNKAQKNLLIADNQTVMFDALAPVDKETYEKYAWGGDINDQSQHT